MNFFLNLSDNTKKVIHFKNLKLILIISVAFILGIGNPFFDYPMAFSVGDEFESQKIAIQILQSKSLSQYSTYLPLWSWLQIPFIGLTIGLQLLFHTFSNLEELQKVFVLQAPGMYLWIARLLSAAISALGIYWVYKIGQELKNNKLGYFMASFYAVDFLRVQTAHFGRHTSIFWFFSLGFGYFLLKLIKYKKKDDLIKSLIYATLATASYQMGGLYFLLLALGFMFWIKKWHWFKKGKIIWTLILSIGFILFLIWLNPGMLKFTLAQLKPLPQSETLLTQITFWPKIWFYTKTLFFYQGIIVILPLLGISYLFKGKIKICSYQLTFILFCLVPFIPYILKNSTESRYLLPLTLLTIWGSSMVLDHLFLDKKILAYIILGLGFGYSGLLALRLNYLMFVPSSFSLAKQWIETNIEQNETLLINGNNYYFIPSLKSQQPAKVYDLDYYRTINTQLKKLNSSQIQKIPNIKFVRPANNLTYLSSNKDYTNLFQAKDYQWIVLDYYSAAEKKDLEKWFKMSEIKTQRKFNITPNAETKAVDTILNIKNPWQLFYINRFGPYIEVEKNISYNFLKPIDL